MKNLKFLVVTFFIYIVISTNMTKVLAVPAANVGRQFTQPTGQAFKAFLYGDDNFNYVTDENGNIITKGNDGFWYYGQADNSVVIPSTARYNIDKKPSNALSESELLEQQKINKTSGEEVDKQRQRGISAKSITSNVQSKIISSIQPRNLLVVLVEFSDVSIKKSDSEWSNVVFGSDLGTLNNYYKHQSNNKFSFIPAVETSGTSNDGVVKVKLNYVHPNTGEELSDVNDKLDMDAVIAAKSYVNFESYDKNNNGILSTDELTVVVIAAGYEMSASIVTTPSVYAHQTSGFAWRLSSNLIFASGCVQLGEMIDTTRTTMGVIAHEVGHTIGLPDLYDTDGSSQGVGIHSLMGSGCWGGVNPGETPVNLDAWSRYYLGFVNPVLITSPGSFTVNSSGSNYNVLKIPTKNPDQYFLVENRQFQGYDAHLLPLLTKTAGIAIWHIDEKVMRDNKFIGINDDESHKAVDLEESCEAIGYSPLDTYKSGKFDYYYSASSYTKFNSTTVPNNKLYGGILTGIEINTSAAPSTAMTVSVNIDKNVELVAFITRFYEECLNRQPDAAGLANWKQLMLSGSVTGTDLAFNFIYSPEFINRNLNNEEYVNLLYSAFFNRQADAGGKANWMNLLNAGYTKTFVFAGFVNSQEFINLCNSYNIRWGNYVLTDVLDTNPLVTSFVNRFYKEALNRNPDGDGLRNWVTLLVTKSIRGRDIAYGFIFSPEFINKNLNNSDFVTKLYQVFFNRQPDISGFNNWKSRLDAGASRVDILDNFVGSQEFTNLCNSMGIEK